MGGQDLLPPAKAAHAQGSGLRSSALKLSIAFTAAVILGGMGYAITNPQAEDKVHEKSSFAGSLSNELPPAGQVDPVLNHRRIEAISTTSPPAATPPSTSPSPPPNMSPQEQEASAAVEATPSVVALQLRSGGKEHTLRLRLLPEHSASSVEFMRYAATHKCAGELYR